MCEREMRKYELTDEIKEVVINDILYELHRIRAVIDIENVCAAGDLGGWIETEHNLSHHGTCWVGDDALVFQEARVYDDALVCDNAIVHDEAQIMDSAQIFGNARIGGYAGVWDNGRVYDDAKISGDATVYGNAMVMGRSYIYENASVYGDAIVCGDSYIHGDAKIHGDASFFGKADIQSPMDYVVISGVCNSNEYDTITFYKGRGSNDILVKHGLFAGKLAEYEKVVDKEPVFSEYEQACEIAIKLAKKLLERGKN